MYPPGPDPLGGGGSSSPIDLSSLGMGPSGGPMDQGGPPPSDPSAGDSGGSGGDPIEKVTQAADLIRQAISLDPDHADKLLLEQITTFCQKYLASQQKLVDTATGAGPGAKVVRKGAAGGSY